MRRISEILAELPEPEDALRQLTAVVAEALGASRCLLWRVCRQTEALAIDSPPDQETDADLSNALRALLRDTRTLDRPLIANHLRDLPDEPREAVRRCGLRKLLLAPILVDGHPEGVVFAANKTSSFGEEDARLASALGRQAAGALRLVDLYHSLRRSDELFRALSENALSGVYLIQDGLFRYVNPALARIFGYGPEEITGRLRPEDLLVPEYRPQVEETRRRLLQEGRTHLYFGTRGLTKDGEPIEIEVRVFPVPYRGRAAVMGTLLDLTAERRAQRAAEERQAKIETLYRASDRLLGAEDVRALAGRVVLAVADIFGHALAAVYLLDEDARGLLLSACSDPGPGTPESLPMNCPNLAVLAAKSGEIVSADGITAGSRLPAAGVLGPELLIPLKAAERVVGVLSLRRREKGLFHSRDLPVLKAFAERAALALEKAWIHERLKERSRQLEQLHELALMMGDTPAEVHGAIARQVSQLLRTPYASVLAVEEGRIRSLALVSQVGDQPGESFPLALTPCRVVVETKDSAIFAAIGELFPEDSYLAARSIKTYIAVPVLDRAGGVVGIVNAMDRRERSFGAEDLRILNLLARRAAEEMEADRRRREKESTERMMLQSEKLAALGQVVAGVAHDLNNPLASVLGLAELVLRRGDLPTHSREALVTIAAEAERARKVVRNLLAFAREHEPERVPTNLNEVLRRTLALRGAEMRLSNLEVVKELDASLPETLADGHLLQQALLNLVLNAEQAMLEARGRGRLLVRSAFLPAGGARRPGPVLHLEIEDNGPGIPPDRVGRIFEPFFTTKPVGMGTGLGLSLAFSIVAQHEGVIWAEAPPPGGARFVVELPWVAVPKQTTAGVATPPPPRGLFTGRRVLLADDETPLRLIAREVLEAEGCLVEEAASGQAALGLLETHEFDLVVSDIRMPDLGGFEVYRLACAARPDLIGRFLFVTGDVASGETADLLATTGCAYLEKPYHVGQLIEKARWVLERVPGARTPATVSPRKATGGGV